MPEYAVTAIGADRPGIVAGVAEALHGLGGNIEDSAMTVLGGHFAMMLLVATDASNDELRASLGSVAANLDLTLTVNEVGEGHEAGEPTHVLSVYGADHPGILAGVTKALAEARVNITNVETRILSPGAEPVYAMLLELVLPDGIHAEQVEPILETVCDELEVDHTLRTLETETY